MNKAKSLRRQASRQAAYICRPCLCRQLHAARTLHTSSKNIKVPNQISPKRSSLPVPDSGVPAQLLESYTKEELDVLKKNYTPAQMAAIEAGEAAIDPEDLSRALFRNNDPWAINYNDDFAKIDPVLDKTVRAPEENHDPNLRFKSEEEIKADFAAFVSNLPEPDKVTGLEYQKFLDQQRLMVGKEEAELNPISYLAPAIPKGIRGLAETAARKDGGEGDISVGMKRLIKQTGFDLETIKKFRTKILVSHRVVNQTRMGKIQSIYYLTIAGNQRGLLGIGEGKSSEAEDARQQAQHAAIRNLQPVPRYEQRTIFGDVKGKVGAVELELMHRPPGFGIRCQHLIYEICRCAGISDLAARVTRSRNKMNTVKATFQALMSQRIPDEVARGLGKKLVDARKVYYGGRV